MEGQIGVELGVFKGLSVLRLGIQVDGDRPIRESHYDIGLSRRGFHIRGIEDNILFVGELLFQRPRFPMWRQSDEPCHLDYRSLYRGRLKFCEPGLVGWPVLAGSGPGFPSRPAGPETATRVCGWNSLSSTVPSPCIQVQRTFFWVGALSAPGEVEGTVSSPRTTIGIEPPLSLTIWPCAVGSATSSGAAGAGVGR